MTELKTIGVWVLVQSISEDKTSFDQYPAFTSKKIDLPCYEAEYISRFDQTFFVVPVIANVGANLQPTGEWTVVNQDGYAVVRNFTEGKNASWNASQFLRHTTKEIYDKFVQTQKNLYAQEG